MKKFDEAKLELIRVADVIVTSTQPAGSGNGEDPGPGGGPGSND